jgi:hypothetical protein
VTVALGSRYTNSVVFISGDHDIRGDREPPLRGTGFIATLPTDDDPTQGFFYVVTAAHVVRPFPFTWVRFPKQAVV